MTDIVQEMRQRARHEARKGIMWVTEEDLEQLMEAFPPEKRWATPAGGVIFGDVLWGLEFRSTIHFKGKPLMWDDDLE